MSDAKQSFVSSNEDVVTRSRTSGVDAAEALELALALIAHACDECDPPMIVCDDPDCQPYGEHYQALHGTDANDGTP